MGTPKKVDEQLYQIQTCLLRAAGPLVALLGGLQENITAEPDAVVPRGSSGFGRSESHTTSCWLDEQFSVNATTHLPFTVLGFRFGFPGLRGISRSRSRVVRPAASRPDDEARRRTAHRESALIASQVRQEESSAPGSLVRQPKRKTEDPNMDSVRLPRFFEERVRPSTAAVPAIPLVRTTLRPQGRHSVTERQREWARHMPALAPARPAVKMASNRSLNDIDHALKKKNPLRMGFSSSIV